MAFPLALLIPIVAPVATELLKWVVKSVIPDVIIKTVPPTLVPLLSTAVGGGAAVVAQHYGIDLGVTPDIAAGLGLAGTGVHQTYRMVREKVSPSAVPSIVLLLGLAGLLGCAALESVANDPKTQQACQAVTILQKAVLAVQGDIVTLGPEAAKVYNQIATAVNSAGIGCAVVSAPS